MSTEVIAAAIGASATICVSCVPVLLRLHRKVTKSKPVRDVVLDELTKVNHAHLATLRESETHRETCTMMILDDVLTTYTRHLVDILYNDATRGSLKRGAKPETSLRTPVVLFQSLLSNAGNEQTELILQQATALFVEYYTRICTYRGISARIRFLTDSYAYFVHAMTLPTTIGPADLVIYNSHTTEFTRNLHLKRGYHERLGINAHYVVVRKSKQRVGPDHIIHAPMYLQMFGTMEAVLASSVAEADAAGARKVWWEWLHDNFAHSIPIESFTGKFSLFPLDACATSGLLTVVSIAEACLPNTLELVKGIHTGVYSFMACIRRVEEPLIFDIIGHATRTFVKAQTDNIGRLLVHCVDDETFRRIHANHDLQCTPGSWNGHPCTFSVVYDALRCVLFCQLAGDGEDVPPSDAHMPANYIDLVV
jgi:hypothetical protein